MPFNLTEVIVYHINLTESIFATEIKINFKRCFWKRFEYKSAPHSKSKGFSLIELSIVLVIIGILLLGVLKGQELINNAKVKSLAQDFRQCPIFVYGYQDKFRALPGDDAAVTSHLTGASLATCSNCLGNGRIDGNWNSTTATDESFLFWQHVRLAALASGTTDVTNAAYSPRNVEGGLIGIESVSNNFISNMSGTFLVCSKGIAAKLAQQLDTTLDDGNSASGAMRIVEDTHISGDALATLSPGKSYTVCMSY